MVSMDVGSGVGERRSRSSHDRTLATTVLALIGLVNIAGTHYAGLWGGRVRDGFGRHPALRLGIAIVLGATAGFVLAEAFELYRSPLMIHWLDASPLC